MTKPFLSLNIPKQGLSGWPVAVSSDPDLLCEFKRVTVRDWIRRTEAATNDVEAELCRLELEKLKATLDLLIPESSPIENRK